MDDVYLLNSPFTFQSMEKHAAYCAMMRLGLKVPETVLVPYKNPPDNAKWAYTAQRYNQPFDLDAIAETHRLPAVHEALRRRRVGRRHPHQERRRPARRLRRLRAAAHAPAEGRRGLRRVRPVALDRRRDDGDEVPARAADARPLRGGARVPHPRGRRRGRHDLPAGERVLPLGVQLLREPRRGHRGASHRLRQRLPGRRADLAALLLPVGDGGAGALDGVHARSPDASRAWTSTPRTTSRSPTATTCATPTSSRATASSPTTTSRPTATWTSAPAGSRTSTRSCWSG